MNDYIQLTKPRITWLILMSTGVGFFFGRQELLDRMEPARLTSW